MKKEAKDMSPDVEMLLEKIKTLYIDDYTDVQCSHKSKAIAINPLHHITFLALDPDAIYVRRTKPFRDDYTVILQKELSEHPEWVDSPSLALEWIKEHPGDWEDNDLLGLYTTGDHKSTPVIDLFWLSIILCASRNKWLIPDLVLTVLIHEWAHAFTDKGLDADGRRGCLPEDRMVCEGIAQYWTHYALQKPDCEKSFDSFMGLCKIQALFYQAHIPWLDMHNKEIYLGMGITARCSSFAFQLLANPIHEAIRQVVRRWTRYPNDFGKNPKGICELSDFDDMLVQIAFQRAKELF